MGLSSKVKQAKPWGVLFNEEVKANQVGEGVHDGFESGHKGLSVVEAPMVDHVPGDHLIYLLTPCHPLLSVRDSLHLDQWSPQ